MEQTEREIICKSVCSYRSYSITCYEYMFSSLVLKIDTAMCNVQVAGCRVR